MLFEDLRLAEPLLRAVRNAGYTSPTPIQSKAIPVILEGRDVLGCAQTGTGKTAAFALPLIQRLCETGARPVATPEREEEFGAGVSEDRPVRRDRRPVHRRGGAHRREDRGPVRQVRALVLCPTRELAQQILNSFADYGEHTSIRTTAIFGGVNQNPQVRALRSGVDVIVATPGRLLDLMNQGFVSLEKVEYLVLDEADHMLDMGFLPDVRRIVAKTPAQRQSLLFSATMPPPIRQLANDLLREPVSIQVAPVATPAERVTHRVYHIDQPQKTPLLVHLIGELPGDRALVFTRTKRGADTLARKLDKAGVTAAAIHGNKSQAARNRALDEFRKARTQVLVATDLAARGIDIDDIGHVFNYDLTPDPETYVHRIGRTGRAGASGAAVSFCTPEDRPSLRAIEKLIRTPLERATLPASIPAPAAADRAAAPASSRPRVAKGANRFSSPSRKKTRSAPTHRGTWEERPTTDAGESQRRKRSKKRRPGGRPQGKANPNSSAPPKPFRKGRRKSQSSRSSAA
ncbi:MAG TPA: DEAD/DEAH box helicase [Phycisphaerae bacterium]|nr:DEAD/DEAH box helicase [Phycisphaerae bacterium]HRW54598.1 DEAD/DEAH box helicase [Phycisphaerae bacterium]